jgi:hypothetical protein
MRVGRRWHRLPVLCLPVGLHLRLHRGLQPLLLEQALRVHGNGQSESERGRRRPRERATNGAPRQQRGRRARRTRSSCGACVASVGRAHPRAPFLASTSFCCADMDAVRAHARGRPGPSHAGPSFLFLPPAVLSRTPACVRRRRSPLCARSCCWTRMASASSRSTTSPTSRRRRRRWRLRRS